MGAKQRLTVEQVTNALEKYQGLAALASNDLGVSLQTIYNYRDRYPKIAAVMREQREKRTDKVELALYDRISKGDTTAIIFYLKTQAKDRGYVERQEITGKDGGAIEIDDARLSIQRKLDSIAAAASADEIPKKPDEE